MASLATFITYFITGSGTSFITGSIFNFGTNTSTNNDSGSNTYSSGDSIVVNGPNINNVSFQYIGFFQDGWVGFDGTDYRFFTNSFYDINTAITLNTGPFAVCFLAGTAIACPEGSRPVEDLAVGDLVLTADGSARPVRFVGCQSYVTFFADPLRTRPIRIAAGSLGEGLPARDLCVSPDHALLVDGALVQAGALVNGTTITRMTDLPERFTYYHVELEDHSLILAEGVPAETFVDNVTRRRFDNYEDYEPLYGEAATTIAEMETPRIKSSRQLPAATRQRLQVRIAALGAPAVAA